MIPTSQEDRDWVDTLGEGVKVRVSGARNIKFHRKFFAMLRVAYDLWEPPEVNSDYGEPQRNFDRFRQDAIILAGYYDVVIRVNGETRIEAKSISFGSMDESDFQTLYGKVIDVVLQKVLTRTDRADFETAVDAYLSSFA